MCFDIRAMSDNWRIKSSGQTGSDIVTGALFGVGTKTYEVENKDTGEVRKVYASDEEELGKKIAEGKFLDD